MESDKDIKQKQEQQNQEKNDEDAPAVQGYLAYHSIELPKEREIKYLLNIHKNYSDDEPVYFREKIHGCNLCLIFKVKENTLQVGKRNEPMTKEFAFDTDPNLFEKQITVSFYSNNVVQIFKENMKKYQDLLLILKKDFPEAEKIRLFGELFGGQYDKPTQWSLIQQEIRYCDTPQYWLFDIYIDQKALLEEKFQYYTKLVPGIQVAPLLFTMKFSEVFDRAEGKLKFEYKEFQSTIPKLLGMQEELKDNYAEGVVLKCGQNFILKVKSNKFCETKPANKKKDEKKANKKEDKMDLFVKKITFPRLQNVMTKDGNQLNWEQAYDKLVKDIREEMTKENSLPEDFDNELIKNDKVYKGKIQKMHENYMSKLKK